MSCGHLGGWSTHLKVRVLKRLDDRYASFGTEREAFFQKVDRLGTG
jgi:hypothetical protein